MALRDLLALDAAKVDKEYLEACLENLQHMYSALKAENARLKDEHAQLKAENAQLKSWIAWMMFEADAHSACGAYHLCDLSQHLDYIGAFHDPKSPAWGIMDMLKANNLV